MIALCKRRRDVGTSSSRMTAEFSASSDGAIQQMHSGAPQGVLTRTGACTVESHDVVRADLRIAPESRLSTS